MNIQDNLFKELNLKIGDIVEVNGYDWKHYQSIKYRDWEGTWNLGMTQCIGKKGTILEINNIEGVKLAVETQKYFYFFPIQCLNNFLIFKEIQEKELNREKELKNENKSPINYRKMLIDRFEESFTPSYKYYKPPDWEIER